MIENYLLQQFDWLNYNNIITNGLRTGIELLLCMEPSKKDILCDLLFNNDFFWNDDHLFGTNVPILVWGIVQKIDLILFSIHMQSFRVRSRGSYSEIS